MASFAQLLHSRTAVERERTARPTADLLDALSAQHVTQWSICELLSRLADDPCRAGAAQDATAVLDYLTECLPMHAAIELGNLRALLKRREIPGDDLGSMFALLTAGHQDSRGLADELREDLGELAAGRELTDATAFCLTANAFCYHQRALVEWEDTVLFPYARQRVHASDLFEVANDIARGRHSAAVAPAPAVSRVAAAPRAGMGAIDLDRAQQRRRLRRAH